MRIDHEAISRLATITRRTVLAAVAMICGGLLVSCSSLKNPPGTVTAQFFQNPDRVWEGIELTLETLGYVVESSNRDEGMIRAASAADDRTPSIALDINQVMRTEDQVNVYVRGVPDDTSAPPDQESLEKAALDFVTVLKRKLGN